MRYVFCKSHTDDRLLMLPFVNLFEKSSSEVSNGGTLTLLSVIFLPAHPESHTHIFALGLIF